MFSLGDYNALKVEVENLKSDFEKERAKWHKKNAALRKQNNRLRSSRLHYKKLASNRIKKIKELENPIFKVLFYAFFWLFYTFLYKLFDTVWSS